MRVRVNVLLQKVECEVCVEKNLDGLVPREMKLLGRLRECDVEKSSGAGVTDQ